MSLLLPGELAWYVTGRFYVKSDETLADYGYFLHLAGIEADLFGGKKPSEKTAHFTFAAAPFKARSAHNGTLKLSVDPVGDFAVYLQDSPEADFDDPQSFARGQCIATFQRISAVVGTMVEAKTGGGEVPVVASNVFSARLLISNPFEFAGRRYDLRYQIGKGITQFGTAAASPLPHAPKDYVSVVPFSGSALALIG